jgi:hypothetical protein
MADKPNKTIEAASRPAQEAVSQPAQSEQAGAGGSAGSATQAESAMRQGADQLRNQMSGMAEMSAQVSQNIITRSGQNFEIMRRIGETLASGIQSAASECSEYAQHTTRRQAELMQQLGAARSPDAVLEIQNRYLQDNLKELLSFSERLSRLSADKAKESGEHLDQKR